MKTCLSISDRADSSCAVGSPLPLLPGYYGHLLYSPSDLPSCSGDDNVLMTLSMEDIFQKDFGDIALKDLHKRNPWPMDVLTMRNQSSATISTSDGIYLQTKAGRKLVNVKGYIKRVKIDVPRVAILLAEEVSLQYYIF